MTVRDSWIDAAYPREQHAGVLTHARGNGLAASTPSARMLEVTQELRRVRQILGEAITEIRRLELDYARYHSFQFSSFGGVTMAQYLCDLVLWESILNTNPQLRGIVEIGTWQGGLSLWLHAQAEARGIEFSTFDAITPDRWVPSFRRCDVFANPDTVEKAIRYAPPTILLCDGGNKPRELKTFGPMVGPDGLVVVHDWGTEMTADDVPDGLTEVYGDFCDELGSVSRVFKVKP